MTQPTPLGEYLVIARGQWDQDISRAQQEKVIDEFYAWLDRLVSEGEMRPGRRLTSEGKTVSRKNMITDGPFGESKEVVGGYWFIIAHSLEEAAQIATGNPCLNYGIFTEIRPLDLDRATPDNTP
jgi:hypothetical protein